MSQAEPDSTLVAKIRVSENSIWGREVRKFGFCWRTRLFERFWRCQNEEIVAGRNAVRRLPRGRRKALFAFLSPLVFALVTTSGVVADRTNGGTPAASQRSSQKQEIAPKESARPTVAASAAATEQLGSHYLMLVNTAAPSRLDVQKIAQFDRSPYDGLAVSFLDAYETSPVPTAAAMDALVARWKKVTTKGIWPWVYLNRMIGVNAAEGNQDAKMPYFGRIEGVDLDGKAGAQKDFLDSWRNALRTAKDTKVPGIVCDLEFYNNYEAYDVGQLARMTSLSQQDVVKLLRQLGTRMADSAADEYPGATLWFLFTGFTRPEYRVIEGQPYYLAATYIVEGLLDEIQRGGFALHVLSGGEVGLGYCHKSVEELRQAIEKRATDFAPTLQRYTGILELTGTMTLWSDPQAKNGWVAKGACGASSAATVEDLEPYMELLFRSYRYNWIYGSVNGGYYAFQPEIAPRFDAAIAHAEADALR